MRLADPELMHSSPVVYDDSSLISEDTLVHWRTDVTSPLREHSGIILPTSPTQLVQVAYEWQSRWETRETLYERYVGTVGFKLGQDQLTSACMKAVVTHCEYDEYETNQHRDCLLRKYGRP